MKRWSVAVVAAAMCSSFAALAEEKVQILETVVPAAHSVSIPATVSGLEAPARLVAVYGADADTLSYTNDFGAVTADGMLSPSF